MGFLWYVLRGKGGLGPDAGGNEKWWWWWGGKSGRQSKKKIALMSSAQMDDDQILQIVPCYTSALRDILLRVLDRNRCNPYRMIRFEGPKNPDAPIERKIGRGMPRYLCTSTSPQLHMWLRR